ncbi:nucleotide pyrophosphohydrolase [Streptomyces sp. NBS 14/10]|uniref:nucleotide pyrophosphohydrolase n=1 Tax=Streptomyces sp. NBS 14/10 TaxID=1945643 RepID=UPI000B9C8087
MSEAREYRQPGESQAGESQVEGSQVEGAQPGESAVGGSQAEGSQTEGSQAEGRDVRALQARLAAFAAARDWQPYHTPKNLATALSVEASELVEIFQWLTPEESARVMEESGSAARVEDEVADVLAYLLQFCEVLGIDALAALAAKIDRNEVRFPATRR